MDTAVLAHPTSQCRLLLPSSAPIPKYLLQYITRVKKMFAFVLCTDWPVPSCSASETEVSSGHTYNVETYSVST